MNNPIAKPPARRRRGIYLLPNLFTTGALFAGFYAIVSAMGGRFEAAAVAVFIAMVLDGMDGRIARMTHTQSDFGAEYDSLSDMVSFGLAPSLVIYEWALHDLGKLGWLAAFLYTAAAALRLARFNTQVGVADKRYFQGLASPSGAALVAGLVWVGSDLGFAGPDLRYLALAITVVVALLMVSNFRYHSFKGFDLKGKVPFVTVLAIVFVLVLVSTYPPPIIFGLFAAYALSGPLLTVVELRRRRGSRRRSQGEDEHDAA
jgi:CDP-diacylglycerol--serine O-phosphatidyltransferase